MRFAAPACLLIAVLTTNALAREHPALVQFGLAAAELPARVCLVRTAGELPAVPGVTVLAGGEGRWLVSGPRAAVEELARRGCQIAWIDPGAAPPATPAGSSRGAMPAVPAKAADPAIQALVDQVSWTGLSQKIAWLQAFGTRYSYSPQCDAAAESLQAFFAGLGLTADDHTFTLDGNAMLNVVATQTGTVHADSFFVICGHYDSISGDPYVSAPGADDNASGTAAVLAAAEILSQHPFKYSVRYICFAGEEQGLEGSAAYAAYARSRGMPIAGVLNGDMLGYWTSGVPFDLEIESNQASVWLADLVTAAADLYTDMPYILHVDDGAWWGDHASFWGEGYPAINHEEAWDWWDPDFNPYYHSTQDVLAHVDPDFAVGSVKVLVAALATLARPAAGLNGAGDAPPAVASYSLAARPNPFNGRVSLSVDGPPGTSAVQLEICDARGRRVGSGTVALQAGHGVWSWDARDHTGAPLASGVYFARLPAYPAAPALKISYVK